jgi:hypothetical protein
MDAPHAVHALLLSYGVANALQLIFSYCHSNVHAIATHAHMRARVNAVYACMRMDFACI